MNKIKTLMLAAVAFVLSFFDKGLDGIVATFTKLDAKLEREIAKLDRQRDSEASLRTAARAAIRDSNERSEALIRNQDRAIRIKRRIGDLTA